jgi:ribonuclease III
LVGDLEVALRDPLGPAVHRDPVSAEAADLDFLAERLGHRFREPGLLREALTHVSAAGGRAGRPRGYERLEFLGDRVLGLVVADMLWRRFPDEAEGPLTRRLTHLVRRETLIEVAREVGLGPHIAAAGGEDVAAGRAGGSLLADVCEAVIAALYLDGGLPVAEAFVRCFWDARVAAAAEPPRDPKTSLQEWAQARGRPLPVYTMERVEGPPHRRRFTVSVVVEGAEPSTGSGTSRRAAEVDAAAALLARLAADGAGR